MTKSHKGRFIDYNVYTVRKTLCFPLLDIVFASLLLWGSKVSTTTEENTTCKRYLRMFLGKHEQISPVDKSRIFEKVLLASRIDSKGAAVVSIIIKASPSSFSFFCERRRQFFKFKIKESVREGKRKRERERERERESRAVPTRGEKIADKWNIFCNDYSRRLNPFQF